VNAVDYMPLKKCRCPIYWVKSYYVYLGNRGFLEKIAFLVHVFGTKYLH